MGLIDYLLSFIALFSFKAVHLLSIIIATQEIIPPQKKLQIRDSNPDQCDEKRECFLCAMPTLPKFTYFGSFHITPDHSNLHNSDASMKPKYFPQKFWATPGYLLEYPSNLPTYNNFLLQELAIN